MSSENLTNQEVSDAYSNLRRKQALRVFGHSRMRFEFGFSWQNYQKPITVDDVANNLSRECPTALSPESDEARDLAQALIDEAVGKPYYFNDDEFMPMGSLILGPLGWFFTDTRLPQLVELAEDPAHPGVKRYQLRYECTYTDRDD